MSIHDDLNLHGKPVEILTVLANHINSLTEAHNALVERVDNENIERREAMARVESRFIVKMELEIARVERRCSEKAAMMVHHLVKEIK